MVKLREARYGAVLGSLSSIEGVLADSAVVDQILDAVALARESDRVQAAIQRPWLNDVEAAFRAAIEVELEKAGVFAAVRADALALREGGGDY
jgi:uncharacterized protein YabE (DUF348 family)